MSTQTTYCIYLIVTDADDSQRDLVFTRDGVFVPRGKADPADLENFASEEEATRAIDFVSPNVNGIVDTLNLRDFIAHRPQLHKGYSLIFSAPLSKDRIVLEQVPYRMEFDELGRYVRTASHSAQ